jgi:hypothetical protein
MEWGRVAIYQCDARFSVNLSFVIPMEKTIMRRDMICIL